MVMAGMEAWCMSRIMRGYVKFTFTYIACCFESSDHPFFLVPALEKGGSSKCTDSKFGPYSRNPQEANAEPIEPMAFVYNFIKVDQERRPQPTRIP